MSEYRIRFRGGWEWSNSPPSLVLANRPTLPIHWQSGIAGPVRLIRCFNRPRVAANESISLELLRVPGLRAVALNGVELGAPPVGMMDWTILTIDLQAARNILSLAVEPVEVADGWGAISLVIHAK